jgi:hypothetical protein
VPYGQAAVARALKKNLESRTSEKIPRRNVYGGNGAGRRIAMILGRIDLRDRRWRDKLIAY